MNTAYRQNMLLTLWSFSPEIV